MDEGLIAGRLEEEKPFFYFSFYLSPKERLSFPRGRRTRTFTIDRGATKRNHYPSGSNHRWQPVPLVCKKWQLVGTMRAGENIRSFAILYSYNVNIVANLL